MNCIVTGGAGFIGSHLVDRLLNEGHQVVVLDNFSTGRVQNLAHQKCNQSLKIVEADVANADDIAPYFVNVDWVFHLAALADIVPSIQRPQDYFKANVDGTFAVLEAARTANVKKFLYTASSSCFGIPDEFPTAENAEIRPQYPYALTKYMGEELVMHWNRVYKLPVISLRLFNVYGPRSRTSGTYGAVFGVFLAQKLAGKEYTVVGDGEQTRDFTYVTDVADAFLTAAQSPIEGAVYNVGSGNTYSINHLIDLLGGQRKHIPKRPGEPTCTYADVTKIQKELGWTAKVSFEEGVKHVLDNIEYWKEAPVWTEEKIAEATKDWFKYLSK
ncbi:SDR family oxidoreductase [Anaeroarcus burkinensis]|uniref:SDR family oxidoreductase n=1 Tax=Anaeroarcus burkinensis TaxID=82376 RepID=UPI000425E9DF|nr:SDR family oxidoreductase [Anaeroarcus burkinensis]